MRVWDQPEIASLSKNVARIRYIMKDYQEPAWTKDVFLHGSLEPILDAKFQVNSHEKGFQVVCDGRILFSASHPRPNSSNRKTFRFDASPDELFYGGGEWFNGFARRSGKLNLVSRESPALLQFRQTYSNIPLIFSNRSYGLFLINSYPSTWKFDSRRGFVDIQLRGGNIDFLLFSGSPLEIVGEFTRLTGRPPLVPRWAFGLWLTSYPQEHQDAVVKLVEQHRQRNIPLDAVILDYHWEEKWHNFKFRKSLIPNPQKLIANLKERGSRLGLIFTPFINRCNEPLKKWLVNKLANDIPEGHQHADEADPGAYDEGVGKGYFAHSKASWWFGKGGMLDFTHPGASQWWHDRMEPLYRMGVDFFKNDDGEYLPDDAHSHNGMNGLEYHNLYGFYYGKSIYEHMEQLDDRRGLVYARSVWAGSQRYPGMFLGDQKPDFSQMRSALRAGLNMSLMGNAYWTADVFGLDGKTDPQTHLRHAQWSLFMPIARYFVRPDKIDNTRKPWSHGQEAEESFKRHLELRYRLLPYYYMLARQAYLTGTPIIRPMVMLYPDDPRLSMVDDQFMLGEDILFAPILERDVNERVVSFPKGKWYSIWTGEVYEASQPIAIRVANGFSPIFVHADTMLPMIQPQQYIPDDLRFNPLIIHLWPSYSHQIEVYDDDGVSRGYQHGEYYTLPIKSVLSGNVVEIEIGPGSGGFFPAQTPIHIKFCFDVDQIGQTISIKNMSTHEEWTCASETERSFSLDFRVGDQVAARVCLAV